jgi:CRP-like cAMP-binding protein
MSRIKDHIKKYINPSLEDLEVIVNEFKIREIKKGRFLLKKGQISGDFIFIEKGCLRVFWERECDEITGWFAFEDEFFCELSSYLPNQPSKFGVQALEDTIIYYLEKSQMEQLYNEYPVWQELVRKFWEQVILHLINNVVSFQAETAEKRYERALQHPKLIQRIPLKYLSSYLGITPTSLSRLRKRK